jgi:PAS domain S-box-containing protein
VRAGILAEESYMTHVLIVEDHEENRNLLKLLLEVNGYRVTAAGDGLEALAAARQDPPDAIVSDALMPKMDGFALCREWMQDDRLKTIPFIFYSATYVRPDDAQFATALGAVRYLIKPLQAHEFLQELRAVLQQWVGHAAPAPAAPLDEGAASALHESALARKLEDKIAQLEAANRKLKESEERFRSLTEMSSDFYWESDAEHRLTLRTSAAKKSSTVSVFERGAQIGERRWDIPYLSPDAAGWAQHQAMLDAHVLFRGFELSRLGSDGTERFISISGDPVFDASGAFTGYRGVGTDITKRKRAEEALRESEHELRAIFDGVLDGILVADARTDRFLTANPEMCRMLGYTHEELLHLNVSAIHPPQDLARVRALFERQMRGEIQLAEDTPVVRKDGSVFYADIKAAPISLGGKDGILGIFRDITERKRAEEQLREKELRYEAVATSAADAFVTSDAAGRIVAWNPSAERMFGYAEADILGQPLTLLIPQRFQGRHLEGMQRVLSGGERRLIGKAVEMTGRRKDASELSLELSLAQWSIGEDQFFTGTIRDITERKAAEAKIQRLTQFYAALSQCNGAIVHSPGEAELFPAICRAAVQFGGMKMAWIGMVDADTRMVRIAARFGERAAEYVQGMEISADAGSPFGRGPSGIAIRENRPVWQQDFQKEPMTAPWHARRAQFGFGASASLPLQRNGVVVGVLTLYAGEVGAFDEAARQLLVEMAIDIGFALDNFAREAARAHAANELRAAEEQFRGLVEQSIAGIYLIQDDKFAYVNPRFAEIFGYASADELIGRESLSLVIEKERGAVLDMRRRVEAEGQSMSYTFTAVRKDGAEIEVGVHSTRATHNGRRAVIGLAQDISEKKRAEEQIQRYVTQLESAFMSTVNVAATLSELRDPYTAGHERRVAEIAAAIGAELGLDARRQEGLRVAGHLHDVGKMTIPAEILAKPSKLTPIEYQLIKGHPQAGYDVLKEVEFPWPVAEVALQHHERIDGSGYPQGLKGEAILFEARILAVADVVEAMATHRPYRPGLGIDKALAEIERGRGSVYDTAVADACLRLFREHGYQLPA